MRVGPTALALSLVLAVGCEDPPPPPPPPAPIVTPAPIVASRTLASDAAFALVAVPDGGLLVWAVAESRGSGIRTISLSPTGASLGTDRSIAPSGASATDTAGQAVELDAFATGRRVGIAWVMDRGHDLRAQAVWSADSGERFGAAEDIGETVRLEPGARGRVVVSGSPDGTLVVHHRIPDAACVASPGTCAMFDRYGLGDSEEGARGTEPLEVQTPCEPFVAAALFHDGTWYQSLCHVDPQAGPSTTVYAIRPSLSYAAPTALPGCQPGGISPLDHGVLVRASCGETDVAHHLDEMGRIRATFRPADYHASCTQGRPVLRIRQGNREVKLQLGAAQSRIESLLPRRLAAPGARAIWTGEAVLVATPQLRSLTVRRFECLKDGRLERTDVP